MNATLHDKESWHPLYRDTHKGTNYHILNSPRLRKLKPTSSQSSEGAMSPLAPSPISVPLATLVQSVTADGADSLTTHDLLDAYATLSYRLRSLFLASNVTPQLETLLIPIQTSATALTRSVSRDIRRALVDPCQAFEELGGVISSDAMQRACDTSTACHYALRLTSDIFRHESLYSLFSDNQLDALLKDVLAIVQASELMTSNPDKTRKLGVWIIGTQRLPPNIILTNISLIEKSLQYVLCFCPDIAEMDGLGAIQHLSVNHNLAFLPVFSHLLPTFLSLLLSSSTGVSERASSLLISYATDIISYADRPSLDILPDAIASFVSSYRRHSALLLSAKSDLSRVIKNIASLAVVSADALFYNLPLLPLLLKALEAARRDKRRSVRVAGRAVWSVLVWCFSELHAHGELDVEEEMHLQAFRMVKQEISLTGVSLVGILLRGPVDGVRRGKDVEKVVEVLKDMTNSTETSVVHEGRELLCWLLGDGGCAMEKREWDLERVVRVALVRISSLDADDKLIAAERVRVSNVGVLEESEIACHWLMLVEIWTRCIENTPEIELLRAWQALLMAQAQLTQGKAHYAPTTGASALIANAICTLVKSQAPLAIVSSAWGIVANVYTRPPAAELLEAAACAAVIIDSAEFWRELITSVGLLGAARVCKRCDGEVAKPLWETAAAILWPELGSAGGSTSAERETGEELAEFLAVPFGSWSFSTPELVIWKGYLERAIALVGSVSSVIDPVVERLTISAELPLTSVLQAIIATCNLLDHPLLAAKVADHLQLLYLEHAAMPDKTASFDTDMQQFLATITHGLGTTRGKDLEVLNILTPAFGIWVEDRQMVLSDEQYNSWIVPLYTAVLFVIAAVPPSFTILDEVASFLVTPFSGRIPAKALAPEAFVQFWTQAGYKAFLLSEGAARCPAIIKTRLSAYSSVFEASVGDVGSWVDSLTTQFNLTPTSVIPDSQPPFVLRHQSLSPTPVRCGENSVPRGLKSRRGNFLEDHWRRNAEGSRTSQIQSKTSKSHGSASVRDIASRSSAQSRKRKILDCVEIVSKRVIRRKALPATEMSVPATPSLRDDDEEYGSWETRLQSSEVRRLGYEPRSRGSEEGLKCGAARKEHPLSPLEEMLAYYTNGASQLSSEELKKIRKRARDFAGAVDKKLKKRIN